MTAIIDIIGREILDSRGNPTVEVDVVLEDGSHGPRRGAVGRLDRRARGGRAARRRQGAISARACARRSTPSTARSSTPIGGMEAEAQVKIDETLIALDGTPNKGGSAPMPSSASRSRSPRRRPRRTGLPLYRYVGGTAARLLPVPMMNIINGGVHADNPIDFQEFMIMPVGAPIVRRGRCAWARKSSTR